MIYHFRLNHHSLTISFSCRIRICYRLLRPPVIDFLSTQHKPFSPRVLDFTQFVLAVCLTDLLDVEFTQLAHDFGRICLASLVLAVILGPVALVVGSLVDLGVGDLVHFIQQLLARVLGLFAVVGLFDR